MSELKKKADAAALVAALREGFNAGVTKPRAWRRRQLEALRQLLLDNEGVLEAALAADLGKSATEAQLTEIGYLLGEIDDVLSRLASWLAPRRVSTPLTVFPARAEVVSEPLGVVLIIAPWNYPLQLLLSPLVGALAAGNAVVLKPSELAPATSAALAALIPAYLDPRGVRIVEGAVAETTWLLEQRYDHIFYTGNGRVARVIAAAAAVHLTPTTLELGGKSPLYIDDSVDLEAAAERIAWAKFVNAGQTCVAPDYVLATPAVLAQLEAHLVAAIAGFFGPNPELSADYGRIVNDAHFERVRALLSSGRVVADGAPNPATRYLPPTVLAEVDPDSAVMQEEIFGPILPFVTVADLDDAIAFIAARPKPLALYVFTERAQARRAFIERTSSGSLAFNVALAQFGVSALPFGGVGESGMGAYHGRHSFDTFSHAKPVFSKALSPDTLSLIYPPYTPGKKKLIAGLLRKLGN
jgi:aldehyde dehydrogenase (NAD+)